MLFSFHQIREKNSLFNVNVNVNLPNINIENENNSTKESNLVLFFLLKQLKTKVNSRVIIFPIFINGIILYLLRKLEKNGEISLTLTLTKILPGIFNRFISYIMKIG